MTILTCRTLIFLVALLVGTFANIFANHSAAKNHSSSAVLESPWFGENLLKMFLISGRLASDVRFSAINSDPKFGMVTVNDLIIQTQYGAISVDELVFSENREIETDAMKLKGTLELTGIKIPIHRETAPFELVSMAEMVGVSKLQGDVMLSFEYDIGQSNLLLSALLYWKDGGEITVDSRLSHIHHGTDLDDITNIIAGKTPSQPKIRANIDFLKIRYAEKGFLEKLIIYLASSQEKRPSKIRRDLPKLVEKQMLSSFSSISKEKKDFLNNAVSEVKNFLKHKGILTISMRPEEPVLVEEIGELLNDLDFEFLNLNLFHDRKGEDEVIYKTSIFEETIKGDPDEAHDLALRFLKGEGIPQNFAKALALIKRVKASGDPEAQFLLATIYANGIVPPRNLKKAYQSALLAGAMGYGRATNLLSKIEDELDAKTIRSVQNSILSTWQENEDAKFLLDKTKSGLSGDVTAMRQLAMAYRRGYNVPRNYFEAYVWANLAVAAGDRMSITIRESLLSAAINHNLLTGAQIVAAQEKASTLWQSNIRQALTRNVGSDANN